MKCLAPIWCIGVLSFFPAQLFPQLRDSFALPAKDSLLISVDGYFSRKCAAELTQLQASGRYRWLNYLPNPGYNPFTGGFSIQFNITAPLAEFKYAEAQKQKAASIQLLSLLEAERVKNAVLLQREGLENAINEFNAQDSLEYFRDIAFNLAARQYERNEMLPSEFLSRQQQRQQQKLTRMQQANAIRQAIYQLRIAAFMPVLFTP